MSRKGGKRRRHPPIGAPTMEVNLEELAAVLERAKGVVSAEDHAVVAKRWMLEMERSCQTLYR